MLNIQSNQLKTHFSQVLRKVEIGEEFLITKHKKAVAKLIPITDDSQIFDAKAAVMAIKQLRLLGITQGELSEYRQAGQR
ncbi:MAG: type II toxin-antitoxin system prevent-host-death family antitoxin [Candidatus Thioglobus sp.]|nr:MAG: type II toxin-antitoxin system prevent-host-death family antitoxin [Candidatus Thioglobus sp.]KAA0446221.1 MAG: type II toxin-antitoxin system prevent-host-death family antitoxin [Candidatus Thioglobus sp.]